MGQLMGTNRHSVTIMKMCRITTTKFQLQKIQITIMELYRRLSLTKKLQLQKIPISIMELHRTLIPTKKLQASIQVVF